MIKRQFVIRTTIAIIGLISCGNVEASQRVNAQQCVDELFVARQNDNKEQKEIHYANALNIIGSEEQKLRNNWTPVIAVEYLLWLRTNGENEKQSHVLDRLSEDDHIAMGVVSLLKILRQNESSPTHTLTLLAYRSDHIGNNFGLLVGKPDESKKDGCFTRAANEYIVEMLVRNTKLPLSLVTNQDLVNLEKKLEQLPENNRAKEIQLEVERRKTPLQKGK